MAHRMKHLCVPLVFHCVEVAFGLSSGGAPKMKNGAPRDELKNGRDRGWAVAYGTFQVIPSGTPTGAMCSRPCGGDVYEQGLVRGIGLSNYGPQARARIEEPFPCPSLNKRVVKRLWLVRAGL